MEQAVNIKKKTFCDNKSIYFIGIAGTGMASAAGLFKEAGYEVVGSDEKVYPPMSGLLDKMHIIIDTPYSKDNIKKSTSDLFIIGNSLSKSHPEINEVIDTKRSFTSFAQAIGEFFLKIEQVLLYQEHMEKQQPLLL